MKECIIDIWIATGDNEKYKETAMRNQIETVIERWAAVTILVLVWLWIGLPANATVRFEGTETQLTTDLADQLDPSICGAYTVYTDLRGQISCCLNTATQLSGAPRQCPIAHKSSRSCWKY